jgi:hypothetical protein
VAHGQLQRITSDSRLHDNVVDARSAHVGLQDVTDDFVLNTRHSDRASSETTKKLSKLWIDVLKDPQAGQGHRDPFIKLMTT